MEEINKIRRSFFLGNGIPGDHSIRKLHLIIWKRLCLHKGAEGPNIYSLTLRNKVMMGKWCWRMLEKRGKI